MWAYARTHRVRTALMLVAGAGAGAAAAVGAVYARRAYRYVRAATDAERAAGVAQLRAAYVATAHSARAATQALLPVLQAEIDRVPAADAASLIMQLRSGNVKDKRAHWLRVRTATLARIAGVALVAAAAHAATTLAVHAGRVAGGTATTNAIADAESNVNDTAAAFVNAVAARVRAGVAPALARLAEAADVHAAFALKTPLSREAAAGAVRAMLRDLVRNRNRGGGVGGGGGAAVALVHGETLFESSSSSGGTCTGEVERAMDTAADLAQELNYTDAVLDAATDTLDELLARVDDVAWGKPIPAVLPALHAVATKALDEMPLSIRAHPAIERLGTSAFLSCEPQTPRVM